MTSQADGIRQQQCILVRGHSLGIFQLRQLDTRTCQDLFARDALLFEKMQQRACVFNVDVVFIKLVHCLHLTGWRTRSHWLQLRATRGFASFL